MKKVIKYLFCLSLLFTLSFTLVGCTNDNKDDTNDTDNSTNETTDNDFDKIDSRVKDKFSDNYEVNRDDVSTAVTYINDNIDNVKDKEVAKKLYEHGSYLEMAADHGEIDDDDMIRRLGMQAKDYSNRVYNAKDDEVDDMINDGKSNFDEFTTEFSNGVDNAVDNFMSFFKTKKNP